MEHPRSGLNRSRCLLLAALAGTLCAARGAHAQTVSQWLTATSGNWTDASRWSTNPFYPTNGNGSPNYRAEILATGSSYTITLNSAVTLDSLLLSSSNATIAHTSGTLSLLGTATLSAGTYQLNGGTIAGGTIDNTASHLTVTSNVNNTFDGVSFLGGFSLGFGQKAKIRNGLSATGTVGVIGTNALLAFTTSGVLNANLVNVQLGNALSIEGTSTLTQAAASTIAGRFRIGTQAYTAGANTFINQGTVSAEVAGASEILAASFTNSGTVRALNGAALTIGSAAWTNSGTLLAGAGSTLTLNGAWSNTGGIQTTGGTINLGGTFSGSGLSVSNAGGAVNLTGVLNNTGATLAFTGATGSWTIAGGRVNGGTLSFSGGAQLNLSGSDQSTLSGVTVNGDWNHASGVGFIHLTNGYTSTGVFRMSSDQGCVVYADATSLDGDFEMSNAFQSIQASGATSLAASRSITALAGEQALVCTGTFTNNGTLRATGSGTILDGRINTLVNNGLARVETGATLNLGYTVSGFASTLTNNGTIEVDHGSLVLAGQIQTGHLGTISSNGGTIRAEDVILDNTGATLDLTSLGQNWQLGRLAITGGALSLSATSGFTFAQYNQGATLSLTNVNVTGDLNVSGPSSQGNPNRLNLSGAINLAGTMRFTSDSTQGLISGATVLTGGVYAFEAASGFDTLVTADAASSVTVAAGTLVRGGRGNLGGTQGTATNNGTIRADVAGAVLGFGAGTTINNGLLEILGGTLGIGGANSFQLNGAVHMTGGVLNLSSGPNGTIVLGSGLDFQRTGGTVSVQGVLDNTGRTLSLDADTGSWNLFGPNGQSTFRGGTLNLADGAQLRQGRYEGGVVINGDFTIATGETVILRDRVDHHGVLTMSAGSVLNLDAADDRTTSTTLAGSTVSMYVSGPDRASIQFSGTKAVIFDTGTTVSAGGQLGGNFSASIGNGGVQGSNSTLINRGVIECAGADKELFIRPNNVVNEGVIRSTDGALIQLASNLGNSWTNSGEILADGGDIWLQGRASTSTFGTVRAINGGRILLGSNLDNSGSTLTLSDTTGSYTMLSGVIKGGHIATSGSARLLFQSGGGGQNVLDGVTFDQDLEIVNGPAVTVRTSLTVNGSVKLAGTAGLSFFGDQTFAQTIQFLGSSPGSAVVTNGATNGGATLTLADTAWVHGGNGVLFTNQAATIVNQGTISADVAGQSIRIHLQRFFNEGVLESLNGGSLEFIPPGGLGMLHGTLMNSGLFSLDGTTALFGDLLQSSTGTTALTVGADALEGQTVLTIHGHAELGGRMVVRLAEGVSVRQGDTIRLMTAWGIDWSPESFVVLPQLAGELGWDLQHLDGGVLKVIPSPGALGATLAGLAFALRRRR